MFEKILNMPLFGLETILQNRGHYGDDVDWGEINDLGELQKRL